MKKHFKSYAVIWAILLALFNLVVFLARPVLPGYEVRYDARFWLAWAFVLAAFVGNLVCAYFVFKAENLKKTFYNLPLITVSRGGLIATLVAGCACMLIPNCPAWVAVILCALILGLTAVAVVKAGWAADAVERIDEKVALQTSFIKNLTVEAEGILACAKSDGVKKECKKVYEAVRYSDPMTSEGLAGIEADIFGKMNEFAAAVDADDEEKVNEISKELVILIGNRNKKCKVLK